MTRKRKLLLMIPIGIAAITLFVFVGGHVVRLLWNTLMPPIFGLPVVTFWQAFGLLALARILFGGLGHGCGRSSTRTAGDAGQVNAVPGLKHEGRPFRKTGDFQHQRFHADQPGMEFTSKGLLGRDQRRVGKAGVLIDFR